MKTFPLSLLALGSLTTNGFAKDWPHFRGPNRNGISDSKFTPRTDDVEILWKVNVGGIAKGSIVISGGNLYTEGGKKLTCLDAKTGKAIWTAKTNRTDSTPSVVDGRVYQMDNDRFVYCFEAKTGKLIWTSEQLPESTKQRGWGHSGSPLVTKNLVVVNIGYGAALTKSTGDVAWQHGGYSGMATPVGFSHQGKPAVALFAGDQLIARDLKTGAELWTIPWASKHGVNAPDPVFLENDTKLFVGTDYGKGRALYALKGSAPEQLWYFGPDNDGGAHAYSSALTQDGELYCFTRGPFAAIDLETGKRRWEAWLRRSGLLVDGKLISVGSGGEMVVGTISPPGFKHIAKHQVCSKEVWNVPAYADGNLYVRNDKGDVFCVRISK